MLTLVGSEETVDVFLTKQQVMDLYAQLESVINEFNLTEIL